MKHFSLILFVLAALSFSCQKSSITDLDADLERISNISDEAIALMEAEALWNRLEMRDQIPYTEDSTVVFLFRGDAQSVSWNGDFNSWGENPSVQLEGERVGKSDLWYFKRDFPSDARLDYKITIDGSDWILDPSNPNSQWSGFGVNSELRMPDWKPEPLTELIENASKGYIELGEQLMSDALGYAVGYDIYIPANYDSQDDLNVIYVTDGQEYSNENLGSMITVLDNLHHLNQIEPTIAVFVSPLDPWDMEMNRRMDEFGNNQDYISFFIGELIPRIESEYRVNSSRSSRAILGTSLGGLNATYFGFTRPDIFQNVAIQAPAYWYREEIFDIVKASNFNDPNLFMSVGTIGDNTIDARNMKTILEEKGLEFTYLEVNEGHSWGAWRTQLDDILIQFFGK